MSALEALATTVLPRRSHLPAAEEIAAGALAFVAGLPVPSRAALYAALRALELSPPLLIGRWARFSHLSPELRERCLEHALRSERPVPLLGSALQAGVRAWRALLFMELYDDARARDHIGYDIEGHIERVNAPRPIATPQGPRAIPAPKRPARLVARAEHRCQVVVVGSGAGGGVAAARLAEAGLDVLVLEEGPDPASVGLSRQLSRTLSGLYREGGASVIHGTPPILFQEGRCLGGSTVVNGGMAWRTPRAVMELWRRRHGLAFMTPEAMEPYFAWVEAGSHVALQDTATLSPGERLFAEAAESLGMTPRVNPRAQSDCRGSGVCTLGCPDGRKQAGHLTYIPRVSAAGGRVLSDARVERVLVERGRAVGVRTRDFSVRADAVVVAGGALQTPALLRRSGLVRRGSPIGANFRCHPSFKVVGVHAAARETWRGAHQGLQIHDFMDEGLLLAYVGIPPGAVAASLAATGDEHLALMERFGSMVVTGALVDDTTTGSVAVLPGGHVVPRYRVDDVQLARFVRATELLCAVHFEAGAERIFLPFRGLPEVRAPVELAPLRDGRVDLHDVELMSVHALGTCAMGNDPARHGARPSGELWGARGLWVADASLLPDRLGINPQLTIQALAARVADQVAASLRV